MMKQTAKLSARIVILNYNGRELLEKCLPSVVEAAAHASFPTRVTVLDNQSSDASEAFVHSGFPAVDFWKARENRVLCSYNDYLKEISEPVVILLNNDIRVDRYFVNPLLRPFETDARTFLVAPKVMSFDGKTVEAGRARAGFYFGMFRAEARYPGYEKEYDTFSETFSSGFGAFSRSAFLELGGYDPLYLPGIMEDADLCLRAKRRGYKLYYAPESVVYHRGQASFHREYGAVKTSEIAHRNTFLFMWKNYSGLGFWVPHLLFLPLRLAWAALRGRTEFLRGFRAALDIKKGR